MIEYTTGNILEAQVDALVNPINTVGIMGKGLALQFKTSYPEMFVEYKKQCNKGRIKVGNVYIYETKLAIPRYIINFPTKEHWKNPSKIEYIIEGLNSLYWVLLKYPIKSIAIPPLGCGLGGLDWEEVKGLIENTASFLPMVKFLLYTPT